MGQTARNKKFMTVAEYLRFEERSKFKHEYLDGEVFRVHANGARDAQLVGNRAAHVFIVSNLCFALQLALRGKNKDCRVGTTEMRVLLSETHYAYPDVFVVYGELSFVPNVFDTLKNPVILIEVLSKSTEARDRGDKAAAYRNLSGVTDYVLVSADKMRVEQQTRQTDGSWKIVDFEKSADRIIFEFLECEITVADIYENINFPPKPHLQLVKNKNIND